MLWKVNRADSSTDVGFLILGEITSSKAFQKVLPSTSLTSIIFNDFSKGAVNSRTNFRIAVIFQVLGNLLVDTL